MVRALMEMLEMRPALVTNSTTSGAVADAGFRNWNSPVPYLFGGLACMLLLIAMALLILACSYKKPPSSSNNSEDEGKLDNKRVEIQPLDMEPKVVVIMAGDNKPTYLAKPVSTSAVTTSCTCHQSLQEQVLQDDHV